MIYYRVGNGDGSLSMSNGPIAATASASTQRAEEPSARSAEAALQAGGGLRATLMAGAGGIVAGLAAAAILTAAPTGRPAAATLDTVATADLSEAALSLDQVAGKQALDDARQCKAPLAYLTIATGPNDPPGRIRIRSGAYLSPTIAITSSPRRVAIPFPEPYASGRGVISIEGAAQSLGVWLTPVWAAQNLAGIGLINIWWIPKNPC